MEHPKCFRCNDSRYFYPEGEPDMSGPCAKCNADGEAAPVPSKRIPYPTDLFPFGKHKNERYGDIQDSYFLWLIDQPWIGDWPNTKLYIEKYFKDEIQ